jgi:hypothetical protein
VKDLLLKDAQKIHDVIVSHHVLIQVSLQKSVVSVEKEENVVGEDHVALRERVDRENYLLMRK